METDELGSKSLLLCGILEAVLCHDVGIVQTEALMTEHSSRKSVWLA